MATEPGSVAGDLVLLALTPEGGWRTRGPASYAVSAAVLADAVLAGAPLPAGDLADDVVTHAEPRHTGAIADLAAAGALVEHRAKVLGMFPRTRVHVLDRGALARARDRVVRALGGPQPPTEAADAVLAELTCAAGVGRHLVDAVSTAGRLAVATRVESLPCVMGPDLTAVTLALRTAHERRTDPQRAALPGRRVSPQPPA